MSCTYYLRDKKISNKTIEKLHLIEKDFNIKVSKMGKKSN